MATVDWEYPITSTISGTTYIKDTDDKIQSAMDDLTLWVNSGTGYTTTGLAASFVDLTTAQTVAGVKSFTSSPIIPAPTTDLQASTKKYVDDSVGSYGVSSGSYTPTITEGSNVNSSTLFHARYMRVGNMVTVFGAISLNGITGVFTDVILTLPIAKASNFENSYVGSDASGLVTSRGSTTTDSVSGRVSSVSNTKTVQIGVYPKTNGSETYAFTFEYLTT